LKVDRQAQDRYAALVEKKYSSSLSDAEREEMLRLQERLDRAEAPFYEPIQRRLESALTKLRHKAGE
jgi:hypothetical protein